MKIGEYAWFCVIFCFFGVVFLCFWNARAPVFASTSQCDIRFAIKKLFQMVGSTNTDAFMVLTNGIDVDVARERDLIWITIRNQVVTSIAAQIIIVKIHFAKRAIAIS